MKPSDRIVGFPTIGNVDADVLASALSELGLNVLKPLPITSKTIALGVRNSADMICFPYKVTMGSIIESLDRGANTILQYTSGKISMCRQKQFYRLQDHTLKRLGYRFEMIGVSIFNVVPVLAKTTGKSVWKTWRMVSKHRRKLAEKEVQNWETDGTLNIALIGEIYCCCDERVNRGVAEKVRSCGANPINTASVSDFCAEEEAAYGRGLWRGMLLHNLRRFNARHVYDDKAAEYFEGMFAGHAKENISALLRVIDEGIDGVIHVLPLSCMPETTIEPYVDSICSDAGVPLLRVPIDENNSDAGVRTRIETFIRLMQWNRGRRCDSESTVAAGA